MFETKKGIRLSCRERQGIFKVKEEEEKLWGKKKKKSWECRRRREKLKMGLMSRSHVPRKLEDGDGREALLLRGR